MKSLGPYDWDIKQLSFSTPHLVESLKAFKPTVIFNLAQQPSAPWSMSNAANSKETIANYSGNRSLLWAINEACPDVHLIKLGTMGEYGTPGIPIPEGVFPDGSMWAQDNERCTHTYDEADFRGSLSGLMFPRKPGSFYHSTKVAETVDCEFAVRAWGLRITDIMQGIVYGTRYQPGAAPQGAHRTRFDVDECFGTVINRFACQALVGHPLTVYGAGGQTRGFLPLCDSIQCLEILANHPPQGATYRVVNQLEDTHSVEELALTVCDIAKDMGIADAGIRCIENPRVEEEQHDYEVIAEILPKLGYQPHGSLEGVVREILEDVRPHIDRIPRNLLMPQTKWRQRPDVIV